MNREPYTCILCGGHFIGWGNNALPVADGRCCSDCNALTVIPTRLGLLRERTALI